MSGRRFLLAAACLACVAGGVSPARASFEAERPGARPAGLAGAFCAVADDADALSYNPSGLALTGLATVSAEYGRLLCGLDDGSLFESRAAFVQPLFGDGSLGLSWNNRNLQNVYQENTLTLGYGRFLDAGHNWLAGAAVKMLRADYLEQESTRDNPYFGGSTSALGFGVDLGAMAKLGGGFTVGFSLANLGQPDLSLHHGGNLVPLRARAGAAYGFGDALVALDYLAYGADTRIAAGGEAWWLEHLFATRLGLGLDDGGASELTAGLSALLQQSGWNLRIDYAFTAAGGAFSGAGPSHLLNVSFAFGVVDETAAKGGRLKAEGKRLFDAGKLQAALEAWEQAQELLPGDAELERDLNALRAELDRRSELELYLREGEEFKKNGNYGNAIEAYRKVLKLDPRNLTAVRELQAVLEKIKLMTQRQIQQKQAEEKQAADRSRQARLRAADEALQAARRGVERARKQGELRRNFGAEFERLEQKLKQAEANRREGESERAQVAAQAVVSGLERLQQKQARRAAEQAAAAAEYEDTPAMPTAAPTEETAGPSGEEALRKRARGAYGRAVKLMLDIDRQQGRRYFPEEYASLQAEIARIKVLLTSRSFSAVIRDAENLYPRLENLKKQSEQKTQAKEVMPTNW